MLDRGENALARRQPASPAARRLRGAVAAMVMLCVGGCYWGGPTEFALNTEGRNPEEITIAQREALVETLAGLFGTPDEPRVPEGAPLDLQLLEPAAGPIRSDEQGRQFGLYRQHCVTCHGVAGSGAGPSARALNPYPRDFRPGWFKFTSTAGGMKPVRQDIERTLLRGAPGTAMPSFSFLSEEEIASLVEYVRYLAMRGEFELFLMRLVIDEEEYLPLDRTYVQEDGLEPVFFLWEMAEDAVVEPPPRPPFDKPEQRAASIARGRELYAMKEAQCVKCHGPEGLGDGEDAELYDDWNKPKVGVTPEKTRDLAELFTLPLQEIRPRNFHEGVFRGGSRPKDLYWRIHVGLQGTPMPAAGPGPGSQGVLEPEEIWHVVHYILSLAYPDFAGR